MIAGDGRQEFGPTSGLGAPVRRGQPFGQAVEPTGRLLRSVRPDDKSLRTAGIDRGRSFWASTGCRNAYLQSEVRRCWGSGRHARAWQA